MPKLTLHGHDMSGTTAQRPTNAEVGQPYFDTDLGCWLVYDGAAWTMAGNMFAKEVTFAETAGAGSYTGSVTVPAGATILDIIVNGVALWSASSSVSMYVGDAADADGYFTGINLKATDLLAGESIAFESAGGKAGAYIANSQVSPRYSASARVITGLIVAPSVNDALGRTRMTVVYALTGTPTVATKS